MDSLTSVSKGCFVVKASKKEKRTLDAANYISSKSPLADLRWEMAQTIWNEMEKKIIDLHKELTSKIFKGLLEFVKNSCSENSSDDTAEWYAEKRADIPTAALITGVNMPDHANLFEHFAKELKSSSTRHVAILHAKHCVNMRTTMRRIGEQLILGGDDMHDLSHGEDDHAHKNGAFSWRPSMPLTLSLIKRWYSEVAQHVTVGGENTKKKSAKTRPAVVIMLQDMEAFQPHILHDLIQMFSGIISHVPIVFVFGIATSWRSVVERLLPRSVTVHLRLEKFYSPSASQHLSLITDDILLTPDLPCKLSGRCLQYLLDIFLCHDFSVTNFLHILKFCVLEHFYQQPASACIGFEMKTFRDKMQDMRSTIGAELRELPSVKKFLRSLPTKRREELQNDDEKFEQTVERFFVDLRVFHRCFFPVMRCLHSLCKSLPRHPLGKQIRELFCMCDSTPIAESDEYKQARLFLQVSSRNQLLQRLQSCVKDLDDVKEITEDADQTGLVAFINETRMELESILQNLQRLSDVEDDDERDASDDEEDAETTEKPLEKVKYAYQLQERLKMRSEKKKIGKMSRFEKLRKKALDILDALFARVLVPPRTMPLHEAFYFDSVSTVKRHAMAAPRAAIQTALSNPYHYLKPCLESVTEGGIPPSTPEVCVAYKLHNECGRLINLYDWMEAFHTIVNAKEDAEEEETDILEIDEETQARFIRAASELQFLGFVKPTKRKTDHVERLTWSST